MIKIDAPLLPPRLYRYRDVRSMKFAERELEAISDNYLWCSRYRDLNDPMEGIYAASPWLTRQDGYDELARQIFHQKLSIGVCCFSNTYENEIMWAHYANNSSGICVGYSSNDLCAGLDESVHIARVSYDDMPPRIGKNHSSCSHRAARIILSHKKTPWLYEREWRLLTNKDAMEIPGPLKFPGKNICKSVHIGSRISSKIKNYLIEKLKELNIKIYTMNVSKYNHKWSQLKKD